MEFAWLLTLKQPLPPSYEEHLSGVPGFRANIDYVVHAIISTNTSVMPNLMKTALFGNANVYVLPFSCMLNSERSSKHRVNTFHLLPTHPPRDTSPCFIATVSLEYRFRRATRLEYVRGPIDLEGSWRARNNIQGI